jgi:hypothetical protein
MTYMADTLEQIAERLTTELFTNGQGQHADRLVLTQRLGSGAEADLGGWCELAVRDRIISALQSLARERDDLQRALNATTYQRDEAWSGLREAEAALATLRANEDAIRSTCGWKRDGRELPDLVADLAARLSAQEPRGQEGE